MALSSLPDDLLLELFRYLDTEELLLARGVCRRWRDLALHPDAWRHRSLWVQEGENMLFQSAVLAQAPCLYMLEFDAQSLLLMHQGDPAWRDMSRLSSCTGCAVRCLGSKVRGAWPAVAKIIRNQLAMPSSRLRSITLCFVDLRGAFPLRTALLDLLQALRPASCLSELSLALDATDEQLGWPADAFLPSPNAASFLKRIEYSFYSSAPDPFLEFLVKTHSATLETIEFGDSGGGVVFSSLARCPNLREVDCPHQNGIAELAQSLSLKKLSVHWPDGDSSGGDALPLLEALSSSKQSALETVELINMNPKSEHAWECLGAALAALPRLGALLLASSTPPPCFLRLLSPRTAPRLRVLDTAAALPCVRRGVSCGGGVTPAPEYLAELRAALLRNPGLHVSGLRLLRHACELKGACWRDGLPGAPLGKDFGVFGHPEGQHCDLHRDGSIWVRLETAGKPGGNQSLSLDEAGVKLEASQGFAA